MPVTLNMSSYLNAGVTAMGSRSVGAGVCVLERARHRSANKWRAAGESAASEMYRGKPDAGQVCACCADSEKSAAHAARLGEVPYNTAAEGRGCAWPK